MYCCMKHKRSMHFQTDTCPHVLQRRTIFAFILSLAWYWSSLQGLCICKAGVIPFSFFFAILTFNLAGTKEPGSSNNKKVRSCFPFHLSLLWSPGSFSLRSSVLLGDGRLCQASVCLLFFFSSLPPHHGEICLTVRQHCSTPTGDTVR